MAVAVRVACKAAGYTRTVRGKRLEAPHDRNSYRSRWERNFARYLDWLQAQGKVLSWEYEPKTFWFAGIKRGTVSYLPDFAVEWAKGSGPAMEWVEVKGYLTQRGRTAIKRFRKYYPDETLTVIDGRKYRALEQAIGLGVPGWER